ncbi:LIM homeobox transcription factor 1-beta [Aphelenchoides bicaudatus]|nr:LIM homeobox transcription factor 1-beta [Aphelenchoides bicaudatus]
MTSNGVSNGIQQGQIVHMNSASIGPFDSNRQDANPLASDPNSCSSKQLNKEDRCGTTQQMPQVCKGCKREITERYFLRVFDQFWHECCLRCSTCEKPLADSSSCYLKKNQVYCKEDHTMIFATKCARCQIILQPTDCVYRCLQFTYHSSCFQCIYCRRELQKGDQYYCVDGQLICQTDYMQLFTNTPPIYCPPQMMQIAPPAMNTPMSITEVAYPPIPPHPQQMDPNLYYEHSRDKKHQPKRPRTILNASQRKSFKVAFEKSPKPSRKIREQLARETGLSVRVVQVWMQNQRAKLKKEQRKRDTASVKSNSFTGSTDSEAKSNAEDELKSVGDSLDDEFDSESYAETLSGRSSTIVNSVHGGMLPSLPSLGTPDFLSSIAPNCDTKAFGVETPINKLYEMQETYFSLA